MNHVNYIKLGLACAGVCTTLNRGLNGKKSEDLNHTVCELTTRVTQTTYTLSASDDFFDLTSGL